MECDFCGAEFRDSRELHIHWGEEHADELNSHQQEKVKKAERKQEEQEQQKRKERRKKAGWAFTGLIAVLFLAVVGPQLLGTLTPSSQQSFDLSGEPMLGSQDANVTVVAFEDFKCPYCAQFTAGPYQQLKAEYIQTGEVKFYFVNNPLPLGQDSFTAAVAGECVLRQDEQQFWNFKEAVFANQGPETERWATVDRLMEIARQSTSGLDYEQLRTCIAEEQTMPEVRQDRQMARSHGITSTPTVFVNGKEVSNPLNYQILKSAVERELQ